MKNLRQGESGAAPERSERFFQQDKYWYYSTREGVNIGPFDTLTEAAEGCSDFIDFITESDPEFSNTLVQYSRNVA
ncbi:hypothetical protein G8770_18640 [Aestuariicella hydrocarbonica]|uniref:DUF6316 domain-containing protein n=1 Tax=Pseudomaricurvus hydrocarbonicus TaxID=1470433 RepID=A0A9E5MNQ9_9GAMM|nr:DUF6316 family protein [Aestuariicella hydrocarbonica]NHO67568.1 hypothetical protein [Aestuariicella hydrocarbonica]